MFLLFRAIVKLAKIIISKPYDDCLEHVSSANSKMYVLDAIGRLKKGKASGPDKITIDLVNDAANCIAYPIMLIFNSSIRNDIFMIYGKKQVLPPSNKSLRLNQFLLIIDK